MKKRIIIILLGILLILVMLLCYCKWMPVDGVPLGFTNRMESFEEIPFQDWTDLCWYQYDSADPFMDNNEFQQVHTEDISSIKGYFNNVLSCLEGSDRLKNYDFLPSYISEGDYMKLETMEGQPRGDSTYGRYDYYTIWLFDVESLRLYYIQNNA